MITFTRNEKRFTMRAAGIAIHEGHVLLSRGIADTFWALPGGRVELMESAAKTLQREMLEELAVTISVERLVYIMEYFYTDQKQVYNHELGFYFLMKLPAELRDYELRWTTVYGDEEELEFCWAPLKKLHTFNLLPVFIREHLKRLPPAPQHIVHHEREPGK